MTCVKWVSDWFLGSLRVPLQCLTTLKCIVFMHVCMYGEFKGTPTVLNNFEMYLCMFVCMGMCSPDS